MPATTRYPCASSALAAEDGAVCQRVAVGDDGGHSFVGRVGDEVFRPEIGVSCTPEYIGGKLCFLVEKCVLGGQVLPQRV